MSERSFREGVPAFVDAYDRVRALIAETPLPAGAPLPGEVALAEQLGVERPVAAEALLLLEEDGYVARDRLRRWVVAPARGDRVDFSDSFHRVLGDGARAVRRLHAAVEEGSSWSRELLASDEKCLVWETLIAHDDVLLASTLEWLLVSAAPPELLERLDPAAHDVETHPTLLECLGPERRAGLSPQRWRLVQVSRNSERLSWMQLPLHGIPAALTVLLAEDGRPVYLAKNLFDLATFDLTVDVTAG